MKKFLSNAVQLILVVILGLLAILMFYLAFVVGYVAITVAFATHGHANLGGMLVLSCVAVIGVVLFRGGVDCFMAVLQIVKK